MDLLEQFTDELHQWSLNGKEPVSASIDLRYMPERPLPPPVTLASQSHHEKPPEVTCTSRGHILLVCKSYTNLSSNLFM